MEILILLYIIGHITQTYGIWYNYKYSNCYDGKGEKYVGKKKTDINGRECLPWMSLITFFNAKDFPELQVPHHNYCRNPKNEPEPFCYIVDNGKMKMSPCGLAKCKSHQCFIANATSNTNTYCLNKPRQDRIPKCKIVNPRLFGEGDPISIIDGSQVWMSACNKTFTTSWSGTNRYTFEREELALCQYQAGGNNEKCQIRKNRKEFRVIAQRLFWINLSKKYQYIDVALKTGVSPDTFDILQTWEVFLQNGCHFCMKSVNTNVTDCEYGRKHFSYCTECGWSWQITWADRCQKMVNLLETPLVERYPYSVKCSARNANLGKHCPQMTGIDYVEISRILKSWSYVYKESLNKYDPENPPDLPDAWTYRGRNFDIFFSYTTYGATISKDNATYKCRFVYNGSTGFEEKLEICDIFDFSDIDPNYVPTPYNPKKWDLKLMNLAVWIVVITVEIIIGGLCCYFCTRTKPMTGAKSGYNPDLDDGLAETKSRKTVKPVSITDDGVKSQLILGAGSPFSIGTSTSFTTVGMGPASKGTKVSLYC